MSTCATTWAYEQRVGFFDEKRDGKWYANPGAKFVLVALADFADANGYCYPGQRTLSEMTMLDERTVRKHLKFLEEQNFISRVRAHDPKGRRTSDDIHLLAPPERLRYKTSQPEESPGSQTDKRKKSARPYRAIRPVEESPAYPSVNKVEPSDPEPTEAKPPASPRGGDGAEAQVSDHRAGMTYLAERGGPIPDPKAQAAALKWLLANYSLERCRSCLDALLEDDWRKSAVSWLTVKKEIGTWLARKEKRDAGDGKPQTSGRGGQREAGTRRVGRLDRIEQTYSERDYERLVDESL